MSSYTGIECGLCRKNHAVKVLVCKECRDVIAAAWPHARRRKALQILRKHKFFRPSEAEDLVEKAAKAAKVAKVAKVKAAKAAKAVRAAAKSSKAGR